MRRRPALVVFSTLCLLALLSGPARPESGPAVERRHVALLRLDLPRGFSSDERTILADVLLSALSGTGRFDVVDREDMDAILQEQRFQASDLADEKEVVELGALVGVDLFAVCTVRSFEGLYYITARLISVETGRVEKTVSRRCEANVDFLPSMFKEVAYELAGREEGKGRVKVVTRPDRAEVLLFGVPAGESPVSLVLAPGTYLLSVRKRGYVERRKTVRVLPGEETPWQVKLVKKKFRLGDYIGGRGFWNRH